MRGDLASGRLQQDLKKQPVTLETFQAVCAPVGKELKRWATENGFEARQISHKARNPGNSLPPEFQAHVTKWKKKPWFRRRKISRGPSLWLQAKRIAGIFLGARRQTQPSETQAR